MGPVFLYVLHIAILLLPLCISVYKCGLFRCHVLWGQQLVMTMMSVRHIVVGISSLGNTRM